MIQPTVECRIKIVYLRFQYQIKLLLQSASTIIGFSTYPFFYFLCDLNYFRDFHFYHLLENDVEVALIAANVKVKIKINTATFSNPILTLNIIFKKNFPTANSLFVFVITSTPFLDFSTNQLNIFCLPDSKIEQNKSRRFLQPEKSNSYEGRIFARTLAVLANPSMFLAHQFIVFLVTLNPLVAMLFSLEGRSNTQFIYSISSRYSFVINSYQEILLETSKQKMFN